MSCQGRATVKLILEIQQILILFLTCLKSFKELYQRREKYEFRLNCFLKKNSIFSSLNYFSNRVKTFFLRFTHAYNFLFFYGRFFLDGGDDVVKLTIESNHLQPVIHCILWDHDASAFQNHMDCSLV